jgi:hypothetical protein
MKNYVAIVVLFYLFMSGTHLKAGTTIELFKKLDGTSFIRMHQVIYFVKFLQGLQNGFKREEFHVFQYSPEKKDLFNFIPADEEKVIKVFKHHDIRYNLKNLVELEDNLIEYKKSNAMSQESLEEGLKELQLVLEQVIQTFELVSEPYLNQIRGVRIIMVKLIEDWCYEVGKRQSYLLAWNKHATNEKEHLRKDIKTLKDFNLFLDDLILFLKDLIYSCPKSYEKYQQQLHKKSNT